MREPMLQHGNTSTWEAFWGAAGGFSARALVKEGLVEPMFCPRVQARRPRED